MKSLKLFLVTAALIGAGACSSTKSPVAASTAGPAPVNKEAYADYAEDKLDKWDKQVDKLAEPAREKLETNIADARIELKELQSASENQWRSYRTRLESAFNRIETSYNQLATRK